MNNTNLNLTERYRTIYGIIPQATRSPYIRSPLGTSLPETPPINISLEYTIETSQDMPVFTASNQRYYTTYTYEVNLINSINSIIPSSTFIEQIFNEYIQNYSILTENEYKNNVEKLNEYIDECPICFSASDKSVKIKKCEHKFCEKCIENWLTKHKYTCPICRTKLKEEQEGEQTEEQTGEQTGEQEGEQDDDFRIVD